MFFSIRFTPDGSHFLVTTASNVYAFNSQSLTLVNTITIPSAFTLVIQFDSDGSMLVSTRTNVLYRYDENFNSSNTITYPEATIRIDGWIFQCDGSKILADREGRVIFVDQNDTIVQIQTAPEYSITADVAITKNGALFVSDVFANKVFI